jgi:hypothetical protein
MKLKGFDTVAGFNAKIKNNIVMLKKRMSVGIIPPAFEDEKTALFSFYSLQIPVLQHEGLMDQLHKGEGEVREFSFDIDFKELKTYTQKILSIFESSDGQAPISLEMYTNLNKLYENCLEISRFKESDPRKLTPTDVITNHNKLIVLLDNITKEIDDSTPKILDGFWKEVKILSNKDK